MPPTRDQKSRPIGHADDITVLTFTRLAVGQESTTRLTARLALSFPRHPAISPPPPIITRSAFIMMEAPVGDQTAFREWLAPYTSLKKTATLLAPACDAESRQAANEVTGKPSIGDGWVKER